MFLQAKPIFDNGCAGPWAALLGIVLLVPGLRVAGDETGDQVPRAGDDREGYESADYATRSRSLGARRGGRAALIDFVREPPLGLPAVPVPADNPVTAAKIELGRKLFFDRRLSANDTMSCGMCHVPEQGFTHNEMKTAVGIRGQTVRRNAPTLYNVAYMKRLFHDGREITLENQVWSPLLAPNEMGNPSVGAVIEKIRGLPDYEGLFEKSFRRGPGLETIGMALASYQRTLLSAASPFDRWHYGGREGALDDRARRGFALFVGKARCSVCHVIGPEHALLTDNGFHNTGVGYEASAGPRGRQLMVTIAPGERVVLPGAGSGLPGDLGLYEITGLPEDRWKYRTPSLRNVDLTAPYMHDGSLPTLEAVVAFYDRGGVPNEDLDPLIRPLGLDEQEMTDLVAFLRSLTGSNAAALVKDAFAAPIGR